MPEPIRVGGAGVDLSPRYAYTETVAASPAAATETIIASLTTNQDCAVMEAVRLFGWCSFTAGTDAASALLRIRRTDASGTIIKAGPAVAATATAVYSPSIAGADEGIAVPNQVYVLTLTVASASAASTVAAVHFDAITI